MTGTGTASFLNTDGTAGVAGFTGIETLTGQVEEFSGLADSYARWTLAPMDIRYQALTAAASDPGAMDFGLPLTLPATTNLLAGANLSDTFIISTAFQGSLNGGTGNDVFRFQRNGAIASNLTGGAGADHLDYSARPGFIQAELAASDADGFSGTATAISGSFFGIDQLTGGMDSSQLIGLDSDATWTLGVDAQGNERNTYALIRAVPAGGPAATDTLIFSGFDGLAANVTGMADNTFNIDRDHQASIVISGRGGDDVFNIRATVRSQFDIALVGSSGDDRFIFANDGAVLSGNTSTGDISGASGNDSLQGDNDGNAFTLTGSNQGTLAEKIAGQFFNIENLIGGTGADTFTFDDAGNLTGNLTGGAGTDTLTGDNNGNTFSLTGGNNGQLADSAGTALIENGFTGIENLTGGTGNDRFAFAAAGSLSGSISGGAGTDHLDYSARTDSLSATLTDSDATGFAGGAVMAAVAARQTSITGGFTGINQLTGGTATDSLTGDDADATWTLGADAQGNERNSYALMRSVVGGQPVTDTLTFSSFDNLTGGSLADTFNIDAAHSGDLDGGAGADTFNIANTLMGNIDGGTGDDTFTFSGAGAITGTLAGGTGDDTLNFMALSDVERLSVMMTDAVTGTGVASFINGGMAGGFTGIETLEGFLMRFTGDANRHARWTLASAGNSYQALTAPASDPNAETVGASINLTASVNTLVGGDLSDTFDIATAFDGTLQGGAGDNTFTFADGGSIAGSITGGAGTDHLDYARRTDAISATLTASDAMGFDGRATATDGFTGIDRLSGGTATDSLTGYNAAATWTLGTAGNSYAVGNQSLVFSNFENLTGGNMADSFTLSIDHTGNLDAGAGDDIFNLANGGEVGEIAGGAGTDHLDYSRRTDAATLNVTLARRDAGGFSGTAPATDGFSGINQLTGRQGDSRLIGMDVSAIWTLDTAGNSYTGTGGQTQDPLRFAGFATLIGRSNADSFTINGDYTGDIIGGDGADAFIFGNDGRITGNLTGGDGDDRLHGDDDGNRFTLSARNEGTLDGKIGGRFFGIENLTGGSGADTFTFEDSGEISGTLEGGMGTDHLDYARRTDAIRVTLTASDAMGFDGRATATDGFNGINRLSGGTGTDSLTGHNTAATWTLGTAGNSYAVGNQSLVFSNFDNLTGGNMADSFTLSADHTGNIDTGAGNDSITLAGSARITGDINLGEGDDSLSFASADVRFMGLADGGAGTDTLNGLDLFTRAMPTTLFRYTNFEIVNGEAELLANLPVIRMQETETTAAMRTLISYVDRPPEGRMPDPDSMGGGQPPAPVPAMPDMGTDTDSTDRMGAGIDTDMGGDGMDMGGMDSGNMAGMGTDTGTGTDTDTPTPPTAPVTPTRETEMAERIAALSRDYGGEVTPLNAAGDGPQDVNAYLFVDPTGPAAQAASVEALSTRINHILNQRLSGGLRGGRHAARPVSSGMNQSMNQSNNQITQRLSGGLKGSSYALRPLPQAAGATGGGDGPLLWGEVFAAERRRGQDGLTLSHVHDYQGLVFGAEQVDPGGQQRLGVLFGYADADIRTDLRSLELDTGSLFGGVYGRFSRQALAINLGLNLGYESHDNRRYIPQLQQVAEADYHSIFVNPWLSLSRAWPLREGLELRPALMLNYSVARYDGYEERGGQGFALAVAGRTAHNLSTRLQLAGVRTEPDTGHELGLRLGVEGRLAGGGHFEGRLGGSSFDYSDAEDRSAQAVFIGLDGRHALSEALTLQLDVEYSHHIGGVSERSLGGFVRLEYAY